MSSLRPTGPFLEHPDVATAMEFVSEMETVGAVVPLFFLPEASCRFESWSFPYRTRMAKELLLWNLPKAGKVRGTVIVGSSAGVLQVQLRDGSLLQEPVRRSRQVRRIQVEIPVVASSGTLEWLQPDGRPSPFVEGHCYRLHFQPEQAEFSVLMARETARAFCRAHPEIRWADENAAAMSKEAQREREDLARVTLPPAPWPFEDAPWRRNPVPASPAAQP
jgi:hypothetical protein